ncbi:hypothetical protein B0A48_06914 [Cryoendolithus antarcticus]|uniref:WW domain-containing protein n=1 Tax=Cryoendolithus antarcticus TaxID=1507870 RepID=A0A1V8T9T1_9PEZI|nr:hypothetical protein B0A48_06914 [Cryoendolithus antarcticus]
MASHQQIPTDAPPSYDSIASQPSGSSRPSHHTGGSSLEVPSSSPSHSANGIPISSRRSMEDEHRPLPKGWVRSFDPETTHQFFVDTTSDPPRSIWTHPYDDDEYLRTLSSEQRERIEQESLKYPGGQPSKADIMHDHTDEEDISSPTSELPPRPEGKGKGKVSFGRKMKDKLTGTTYEERQRQRAAREEEERRLYAQHLKIRQAMAKALETGQPQLVGKDKNGEDMWLTPPPQTQPGQSQFHAGRQGYPGRQGYYSPYGYGGGGLYAPPGMYARPMGPYRRPYGGGFGGGMGLPIGLGMGAGLLGGGLLGGAMLGGGF